MRAPPRLRVALVVPFVAGALGAFACARPIDLVATPIDASIDAPIDAGGDAGLEGAPAEAAASAPHDACASGALVTVLAVGGKLLSFDPRTDAVTTLGAVACSELAGATPIALAVDDAGLVYVLADNALIVALALGTQTTCTFWGKAPALPSSNGAALAIVNSKTPLFDLGVDQNLFRTSTQGTANAWTSIGSLDPADHARALLGTGDGRLFAVVAPGAKGSYRVTSIDPERGTPGATVLVPTPFALDPENPAGFALWGDTLLVFTEKALARYDFATGVLAAPEIVPELAIPIVAAAAPPCASTL